MKRIILLLTALCFYSKFIYSEDRKNLTELFSLSELNSVNLKTGEWVETGSDFDSQGPHPLSIKRIFYDVNRHPDELAPEWQWSLPQLNTIGLPLFEMDGYQFTYNQKKELVSAKNKFGQEVTVKRPDSLNLILNLPGQKKIQYQFEVIDKVKRLKKVKKPGFSDTTYTYEKLKKSKKLAIKRRDDSDGRFAEWRYDDQGRVSQILAPTGTTSVPEVVSTFVYHTNQTEVIDSLGGKKVYTFNASDQVTSIEHYLGKLIKKEIFVWEKGELKEQSIYDGEGRLLISNVKTYDKNLRLTEDKWIGDLTGTGAQSSHSVFYTYDSEGRLITEREGAKTLQFRWKDKKIIQKIDGDVTTDYKYDSRDLLIEEITYCHRTTLKTVYGPYNILGLPLEIAKYRNDCLVEHDLFTYTAEGWLSSETIYQGQELVKSMVYERDVAGRVLSQINHKGEQENFLYDAHGNIIQHLSIDRTKPLIMKYDFMNRLISTQDQNAFTYDSNGNTLTKIDEFGNTTYFKYDGLGRLIETIEPPILTPDGSSSARTVYTYDAMNRVISKTDPMGYVTYYQYTARGETKRVDHPDGSFESYEYFPNGKLKKALSRNNRTQEYEYDAHGRLISFRESTPTRLISHKVTRHELDKIEEEIHLHYTSKPFYNQDGSIEKVIVQDKEGAFEFKPESKSNKETSQEALNFPFESHKVINERGETVLETTLTLESGVRVVKRYNARNLIESVKKIDPMGQILTEKLTLYNLNGEIVQEISQGQTIQYRRGPMGRLDQLIEAVGTPKQRITSLKFDSHGNQIGMIKPDGEAISFKYDGGDLIELKSSDQSIHYQYRYDGERLVEAVDLIQGRITSRKYNALDEITEEVQSNGLKLGRQYNSQGLITALILPDSSAIEYVHQEGKLKGIKRISSSGETLAYHQYDDSKEHLIHNLGTLVIEKDQEGRTTKIASPYRTEEYFYEGQLKSVKVNGKTTHTYTYDNLNRLTSDNEHIYGYDERDNLKLIDNEHFDFSPLNEIEKQGYKYDLNGNLIQTPTLRLRYDPLNRLIQAETPSGLITYTYDPFNRRMSRNQTLFIWDGREEIGSYEKGIQDLKVMKGSEIAFCEINQTLYAVQKDFKGTIALYISPFESMEEGPWSYTGKRLDPATGFIFFGARDYDPITRRFISTDPKGFVDGFNLYAYARNNPNSYTDFFGHTSILDSLKSTFNVGLRALTSLYNAIQAYRDWVNNFTGLTIVYHHLEEISYKMLGKSFLAYCGIYPQSAQSGVFGDGEIDAKVRISFAHGILNIRSDLVDNLRQLSITHGGVNIHYVYRPTEGFAWDILKCMAIKFGWVSPEAKEIVRMWKGLIEEMGGVEGGGKIIHYAHSLGGTDTYTALSFLTAEEQKMIDIRTIGSATLIPEEGYYTATNYVSKRDGVCLFDPVRYFKAKFKGNGNTVFVGDFWVLAVPFTDHPMSVDSYQEVIRALGQAFLETYGH